MASSYTPPTYGQLPAGVSDPVRLTEEQYLSTLTQAEKDSYLSTSLSQSVRDKLDTQRDAVIEQHYQTARRGALLNDSLAKQSAAQAVIDAMNTTDVEQLALIQSQAQEIATKTQELAQSALDLQAAGESLTAEQQARITDNANAQAALDAVNASLNAAENNLQLTQEELSAANAAVAALLAGSIASTNVAVADDAGFQ